MSDPLFWTAVDELFTAALALAPGERRQLLAGYQGPPGVRREVESLLLAHESEDAELLPGGSLPPVSLVGRRLGPWAVVREVGRGGMGTVYEGARQDAQFEKRVAIKTLRLGADSTTVLQRFRQERQILAGLQHPNIAGLIDGGVTDDGLPYFILEYVDGKPIDGFCAERRLDLRSRLDLFRQVVGAVQYAHRQLVIHRDLKPSNILVDREGVVKLVDFGIAKLLQSDGPDVTADARAPLTINYASPEQVKGEPIGTATDVYSLGVVLYRLLTGRNPLELDSLSLDRAVTAICGETPPPPSQAATEEWAAGMQLGSADRLRRELRGELDAIVMMALRKEPDRRYPTVQAFGEDLQRFLKGMPVAAAPDTMGYRLGKFVRRRRGVVAAGAVAVAALVGGSGLALWQAAAARAEARKATRISDFLQSILGGNLTGLQVTRRLPQAHLTLQEVLDTAAAHLPGDLAGDPLIRASLHRILGDGYAAAMRAPSARQQFDSALAIHLREKGPNDTTVAVDLLSLGFVLASEHPDSAEPLGRRALQILDRRHVPDTATIYVTALNAIAQWQSYQGKLAGAESSFTRLIAVERARARPRLPFLAYSLGVLGLTLHNEGKLDSAEATMRRGIATFDSSGIGPNSDEAIHLMTFGTHLNSKGRGKDAVPVLERSREMARLTIPPTNAIHLQIGMALAEARSIAGDTARAHAEAKAALALISGLPSGSEINGWQAEWIYARMLRREKNAEAEAAARLQYAHGLATTAALPYYLADTHYMLGAVLSDRGKYAEAEPALLAAYTTARDKLGPANARTKRGARELAQLYLRWGRDTQATPFLAMLSPEVADSVRQKIRLESHGPPKL